MKIWARFTDIVSVLRFKLRHAVRRCHNYKIGYVFIVCPNIVANRGLQSSSRDFRVHRAV